MVPVLFSRFPSAAQAARSEAIPWSQGSAKVLDVRVAAAIGALRQARKSINGAGNEQIELGLVAHNETACCPDLSSLYETFERRIRGALERPTMVVKRKKRCEDENETNIAAARNDCTITRSGVPLVSTGDLPVKMLGLPSLTAEKAVSAGLLTAADLAARSAVELGALHFTPPQIQRIRACLEVSGLTLAVASSHGATDGPEVEQGRKDGQLRLDCDVAAKRATPTIVGDIITDQVETPASALIKSNRVESELPEAVAGADLASDLFNAPQQRRRAKPQLRDDERARRSANRASEIVSGSPTLDHPRVAALRETVTMKVEDVAFLLNVSKGTIYEMIQRDPQSLPHLRVGTRIKIPTRAIFAKLGLD